MLEGDIKYNLIYILLKFPPNLKYADISIVFMYK